MLLAENDQDNGREDQPNDKHEARWANCDDIDYMGDTKDGDECVQMQATKNSAATAPEKHFTTCNTTEPNSSNHTPLEAL